MSIPGLYMSTTEFISRTSTARCTHDSALDTGAYDAVVAFANFCLAWDEEREDVAALIARANMRPGSFPAESAVPALVRAGACTDALSLCHPGTTWDDVRRVCKVRDDWRAWLVCHGLGGKLRLLSPDQRQYLHAARMQRLYAREADEAYDIGDSESGDQCRRLAEQYQRDVRSLRAVLRTGADV